jgi:4'-phosphopantetheinyl transferase
MKFPSLASDEVHCWSVPLDASPHLPATLSQDERDRCARFRFERDGRRFGVAHGALRGLLGSYLEIPPERVRFAANEFGRPELGPEFGGRLKFNLSHSGDLALIAIAEHADVGVDVEVIRPSADYDDIARHFFSPDEIRQLNETPSRLRPEAFLMRWTQMEAYVKARGEGLGTPLTSFSVSTLHKAWSIYTLQPAPGYVGALAFERAGWRLRQWRWNLEGRVRASGPDGAGPGSARPGSRGARAACP